MTLIKKAFFLLEGNNKKFLLMVPLFLLSSFLDLIGIGILAPFIGLLIGNDSVISIPLFQFIFDYFRVPQDQEALIAFFGKSLLIVFFIKIFVSLFVNYSIIKFSFDIATNLRVRLIDKYQSLSYKAYSKNNIAKYVHNIFSVVEKFAQGFLLSFLRLISEIIVTLIICSLLFSINSTALIILLSLFIFFGLAFQKIIGNRSEHYGEKTNIASKKLMNSIDESMYGFKFIRVLKIKDYFNKRVFKYSEKHSIANTYYYFISIMPRYLFEMIIALFIVIIGIYGSNTNLLSQTLIVFATASLRLQPSMSTLVHSYNQILYAKNSIDLLYDDLSFKSSLDMLNNEEGEEYNFLIKFLDVSFFYDDPRNIILKDVSFTLREGDIVGVMGSSGSGKTTLIDLMLALNKPSTGEIKYHKSWFDNIIYNPQDDFLVDDTLSANIAIGDKNEYIDSEKILNSMHQASLSSLKDRVSNNIGYKGEFLSGGQKQRIALARAFYFNKKILIIDEPTSALDDEIEIKVINSLKRFKSQGKTIIVISHNLDSLDFCDYILKVENGKINVSQSSIN
jgi:ATP-binding cassette, subfamily B, bacterial PglK